MGGHGDAHEGACMYDMKERVIGDDGFGSCGHADPSIPLPTSLSHPSKVAESPSEGMADHGDGHEGACMEERMMGDGDSDCFDHDNPSIPPSSSLPHPSSDVESPPDRGYG